MNTLGRLAKRATIARRRLQAHRTYTKYRDLTMIPPGWYAANLLVAADLAPKNGCIVECGVWRGGMSAGLADTISGRTHFLFDSFEGLPPAKADLDGSDAIAYQRDKTHAAYHDNCRAERSFAEKAMGMSAAKTFTLMQGWFNETLRNFAPPEPIAILRLDGDWYESTMECLNALYPHVAKGGVILIDDYYTWDGCARAIHDYLSAHKLTDRIERFEGACYMVKRCDGLPSHLQASRAAE
jgi:O-methyltransferase